MDVGEVGGVVLAAGRSSRMGASKALLRVEGVTFLERAVRALASGGCAPVVVVLRPAEAGGAGAAGDVAAAAGALAVVNSAPDAEQLDSLRLGLGALPADVAAAVVLPVDHPLVRPGTVSALVARWRDTPEAIVRPVYDGRPGHPAVFPRSVWPAFAAELPRGARSVVEDESRATVDAAVDDPGVIADIDTPASFARWVEGG